MSKLLCLCGCGREVSKPNNKYILGHHMNGVKRSIETKRKLSEQKLKNNSAKRFDVRIKMSQSHLGVPLSEKHRKSISKSHIGKTVLKETCRKISESLKGKHHTEETKKKLSEINSGRVVTEETRKKISLHSKGRKFSEESKEKIRIARYKQVLPTRDTSIEIALQNELNKRSVEYEKHIPICNCCQPDIVIKDKRVVIFCDGIYWHNFPYGLEKDYKQNDILRKDHWNVYRFWENEIKASPELCIDSIMELNF